MTIVNYQTVNCTKRILFVRSSEPSKLFVLIFFRRQIIKMLLNLWFLIGRFHMAIAAQHNIYTYVSGYLNSFWAVSKINYDLRNVRFALFRFFVFFFFNGLRIVPKFIHLRHVSQPNAKFVRFTSESFRTIRW